VTSASPRSTGDPRGCRCIRCRCALRREAAIFDGTTPLPTWPPPSTLPPCPWDGHLAVGEVFAALYLPDVNARGLFCERIP
jgi:hypothetical protein